MTQELPQRDLAARDEDPRWSRERLQSILETAADVIITIDEQGLIETANPALERLLGYSPDEVIGKNVSVLAGEPHATQHDDYLRRYLDTGLRRIIGIGREVEARHKDGSVIPVDLAVSESRVGEERIFTGIIRDLRERVAAERALRSERDFIAAVLDTTGGLVVVLDREGSIVRFNRSCEELTGYEEQETIGRKVWDFLLLEEEVEPVQRVFEDLRAGRYPGKYENCWLDRSGRTHLIAWSNTLMLDGNADVEYVIATGIEITEQRNAQQQIAQQEKLAAVGQLAAGVAHEVGNPLASISAVVQTMRRKLEDEYARGKLDLIAKHIERISIIVRQMVDFARPPRMKWTLCDVNEVLAETLEMARFDRRARKTEVVTAYEETLERTFAVRDQLSQVFLNIILNAFDAMDHGDPGREPCLTVRTCRRGGQIEIAFEDNGPGMPPEVVGRALEPFFTTKDVGQGTGLGLAVSYGIIKDHGGDIELNGREGDGAHVIITLPVTDRAP